MTFKDYLEEVNKKELRKKVIEKFLRDKQLTAKKKEDIINNFFSEVDFFIPEFLNIPHSLFFAVYNIIAEFNSLISDVNVYYLCFISGTLIFFFLSVFFTYPLQRVYNQQINDFRLQENTLLHNSFNSFEKKQNADEFVPLLDLLENNFRLKLNFILKKNLTNFYHALIPGIGVISALVLYRQQNDPHSFFLVSWSTQTIF